MRYSVAAFVLQIIALVFGLVALGLASYVFHYDRQWYRIVQLEGHMYFETFVTPILSRIYNGTKDVFPYGGFGKHHRIRTNPPDNYASNFLRHPKSPGIIFLALLVLTNLMQLCALIVTCARKIRFLPQPCRENGCWYIIIGLLCTAAAIIELISRLEINSFYGTFHQYTNSTNEDEKMGAIMLASCGGEKKEQYEKMLEKLSKISERDDLYVCQRFAYFIAAVVLEFLCGLFCFIVAVILCCFWKKKAHVDQADAESLDNDTGQKDKDPGKSNSQKGNNDTKPVDDSNGKPDENENPSVMKNSPEEESPKTDTDQDTKELNPEDKETKAEDNKIEEDPKDKKHSKESNKPPKTTPPKSKIPIKKDKPKSNTKNKKSKNPKNESKKNPKK